MERAAGARRQPSRGTLEPEDRDQLSPRPITGAASAFRSGSRSPTASAIPDVRTASSSAANETRSVIVRSVNEMSSSGIGRAPNASITFPAAVAWATLGRPTRAMLTTLDDDGTKSTVIASPPPGTDRVAVSPVSSTSHVSHGRARSRTSSWPSTRSDSATSFSPSL